MRLEHILHILRDTGDKNPVLTGALPERKQEIGGVLMTEQQIDFVKKNIGLSPVLPIRRNPVQDAVQHHQHPDGHQRFAEVVDVVAKKAVLRVHIRLLCKGVECAVDKQFHRKCHALRLRFRLGFEDLIEILERWDFSRTSAIKILPVHACGATVNDRLLPCRQLSRRFFTERTEKFGFQRHRIGFVPVGTAHIQSVDMVRACGRNGNRLSAEGIADFPVLPLRVNDENICVRV